MNCLFWGLFLILIDVNLNIGSLRLEILPDFIGFFLMMRGMESLAGENRYFDRGRHLAFGLCVASVLIALADLMDLSLTALVGLSFLGLIVVIGQIVLLGQLIKGIKEMEESHGWELESGSLRSIWLIFAVLSVLCHLIGWVPLVGSFCWTAALIVGILFLGAFWNCRKRYREYK